MSEADEIIRKLNTEQRNYLNRYFAHAPESVTGSMQVVRMPEGMTFIQEGMPVDKVYVLLKGCVSAVDYRVRETVYGFCHFNPIETFGAMEILGHMDQYRTTLAKTIDRFPYPVVDCGNASLQKNIHFVHWHSFLNKCCSFRHPYHLHTSSHTFRCMSKVTVQVIPLFRIQFSNDFICFTHFG